MRYKTMTLDMSKKSPLADGIRKKMFNERRNYSIIVVGKTQTRKSTVAIRLAMDIDSNFDMERQLASIKPENYLKVLNLKGLKRGAVLVLDEFGVGMDHRSWYSFLNKALNYVMQTHGFRGWTVIVTTPYAKYVDSDTRMLFDMMITTVKKVDRKGLVYCKIHELQYNQRNNEVYTHRLYGKFPDGSKKRLDFMRIKYPSKDIMKGYFKVSDADKMYFSQEMEMQVKNIRKEQIKQSFFDPNIFAKEIIESINRGESTFKKEIHNRTFVPIQAIKNKFNIGVDRAKQVKYIVENEVFGDDDEKGKGNTEPGDTA